MDEDRVDFGADASFWEPADAAPAPAAAGGGGEFKESKGLTTGEAEALLKQWGPNALEERRTPTWLIIFRLVPRSPPGPSLASPPSLPLSPSPPPSLPLPSPLPLPLLSLSLSSLTDVWRLVVRAVRASELLVRV